MVAPPFIDTNILLYAGSNAAADAPKRRIASSLLLELDFCISSQVVQEYLSNAIGRWSAQATHRNTGAE
jgi:predicted nucleic acid-binding protein